jgi:hypothetical protein
MSGGTSDGAAAPGRQIVFFHLFKCGGTTVIERLRSRVGAARLLHVRDAKGFEDGLAARTATAAGYDVIAGHLDIRTLERHFAGAAWITVLRDPIDRAISQYHHFRSATAGAGDQPAHRFRVEFCRSHGLIDFVRSEDPRLTAYTRNFMARKLSGLPLRAAEDTGALVDAALANLRRFALVDTTDRLDARFLPALDGLVRRRGLRLAPSGRANTGTGRSAGPAERDVIEAILDTNRADAVLYAAVRWFDPGRSADGSGRLQA